jgi:hypothetical protein
MTNRVDLSLLSVLLLVLPVRSTSGTPDTEPCEIGIARVDVTPDVPIRLSGYLVRKTESEGVTQRLYAKALAIGSDQNQPAVLVTVDATGIPGTLRDEVARRLRVRRNIKPERLAVCVTHTHSAPCLQSYLPTLFGEPIPAEHQARIERYTAQFTDALERVALAALDARRPGRLAHGKTSATFAVNRRTPGGPVDHDLPVLVATGPDGGLRAMVASYACHCTTLGGEFNQSCGDWAGYAQEILERDHPGTTVLMTIGCGGDANPAPRTGLEFAKQHGQSIASAVTELLRGRLRPIRALPACYSKQVELPFDALPTRAEWEAKAREQTPAGYHARVNLAKLDRGEILPANLDYTVQSWVFSDDLAMVFLPGEVVVDYSLRLKREFDRERLWVVAYANAVPCYIPSERILKEGGYEGGGAMIYYDLPTRFAPGLEARIVGAVQGLLPAGFLAGQKP